MSDSAEVWPQPSRLRRWTDPEGTVWRRVGEAPLSLKAARRSFSDQDRLVVHFCGVDPKIITDSDARRELWSRVATIMRGDDPNVHADVKVFRFRDDAGASMTAVEESC